MVKRISALRGMYSSSTMTGLSVSSPLLLLFIVVDIVESVCDFNLAVCESPLLFVVAAVIILGGTKCDSLSDLLRFFAFILCSLPATLASRISVTNVLGGATRPVSALPLSLIAGDREASCTFFDDKLSMINTSSLIVRGGGCGGIFNATAVGVPFKCCVKKEHGEKFF